MKLAKDVRHTYETVEAQCPHCDGWSTYNVATEIHPKPPVTADEVICRQASCQQPFRLIGTGNHPFEILMWEAERKLRSEQYATAVIQGTQAFEVFAACFLRTYLVYLPSKTDSSKPEWRESDRLMAALFKKTARFTFHKLRNVVLVFGLENAPPTTLGAAALAIEEISKTASRSPDEAAYQAFPNQPAALLLQRLKASRLGALRNRVVHKDAHLPSKDEAWAAVSEMGDIIFGLKYPLKLDVNDPWGPRA